MNKAFEKILKRLEELQRAFPTETRDDYFRGNGVAYKNCIKIVQEVAEEYKDGWIPCSEQLPPEQHVLILVCTNYREIHLCRYHKKSNRYFYDGSDWNLKENEVIAWQPLPKLYKEKE